MTDADGYAVYLYPQALEALGPAIAPYLSQSDAGPHVLCASVDTAGAFVEMNLLGRDGSGRELLLELMVPAAMVRMVVSVQSDAAFGFAPRTVVATRAAVSAPVASSSASASSVAPLAEPAGDAGADAVSAPSTRPVVPPPR